MTMVAASASAILPHSMSTASDSIHPRRYSSFPPPPRLQHRTLFSRLHHEFRPPSSRTLVSAVYSSGGNGTKYSVDPIDVVAKVQIEKILVLGGSGFVGSAICKAAVSQGIDVISLSRSGRPSNADEWVGKVEWIAGDLFNTDWDSLLNGVTAVISTVGGFGDNEQMEKINGEANIIAINAATDAGVRKFVYVSVHDYNIPDILKSIGYFSGKKRAENEVLTKFATTGTVLRPAFIYGKRNVNGIDIPLDLIGEPWGNILSATKNFIRPLQSLPASDIVIAPPVSVDDVAYAAIKAVIDDDVFGIQTIEQIKELASAIRAN